MTQHRTALASRLANVQATVGKRLDRLDAYLPMQRARKADDFEEYLARAAVHADRDPAFRADFARAMQQYQTAKVGLDGTNQR